MSDDAPGSTVQGAATLRQIDLPGEPVPGGLYWYDPGGRQDGEHALGGRIEVPIGARVTVYTDGDAPPPDLSFLDALPSDLPTALHLHGLTGDDLAGLRRFTGLELLGLTGDLGDAAVAGLVAALPRLCMVDLDADGIVGECLDALPAGVVQVTIASRRLDPASLAALAGGAHAVETLGLARVPVDDALVDALVGLRPRLRSVFFDDPPARPTIGQIERLLDAGLEVDGVSAAPGATARFARIVLDTMEADGGGETFDGDNDNLEARAGDDPDDDGDDRPLRSLIDEAELDALVARGGPVLVDLTATWCGPCQVLKPVLHEIDAELGGQLTIVAVDVDDAPWTEQRFAVQGIPTMVLLDDGRELGRITGAHPKRTLLAMITAALPSLSMPVPGAVGSASSR